MLETETKTETKIFLSLNYETPIDTEIFQTRKKKNQKKEVLTQKVIELTTRQTYKCTYGRID